MSTLRLRLSPFVLVIVASAVAWGALLACVPPGAQNFPLADDWVSTRSVSLFAQGQGIHYLHGRSVPQLGQWLWATPFVWLAAGSVHVALRLSTIVLAWLGLWGMYDLLRQEDVSPGQAALATAVLAFTPLFFLVQGTFMNDVPALALSLAGLALYGRAIRGSRLSGLVPAVMITALAVISRQNTLCVPLTAAVMLWRRHGQRTRFLWILGVLGPLALGLATEAWFVARLDVVPFRAVVQPPRVVALLVLVAIQSLGMMVLPLMVADPFPGRLPGLRTQAPPGVASFIVQATLSVAVGGLLFGLLYSWPSEVTFFGNFLHPLDPQRVQFPYSIALVGPRGPFGGIFMVGGGPLYLDSTLRWVLTVVGYAAGAGLLWRLATRVGQDRRVSPLLVFAGLQLALLAVCQQMNDRYFLFLAPAALYIAVPKRSVGRLGSAGGIVTLVLMGAVSVGLMHDWLSWNAARWRLGRRAVAERMIDPWDIEGGFEWDGWFAPETQEQTAADHPHIAPYRQLRLPANLDFRFLHVTGRYAISFDQPPGSTVLDSEPYRLWLLPGERSMLFVEYPPPPPPEPTLGD